MICMGASNTVSEFDGIASSADSRPGARDGRIFWGTPREAVRKQVTESHATPWWLWWNILSLDAPTVAVMWAFLFARQHDVRLRPAEAIILGLVVWGIYVSDRLLDGWRVAQPMPSQARHQFCARHRVARSCLAVLAGGAVNWAIPAYLTLREAIAGLKLAAIVGAYMASVHARCERMPQFVPKEVVVGVLFAAGTTLPVWSRVGANSWNVWATFLLFAVLCTLNCLAIECWESRLFRFDICYLRGPVIRWADAQIGRIAAAVAGSALIMVIFRRGAGTSSCELLAISLAALLILYVNLYRDRISGHALRVLADAALVVAGLIALMTPR